MSVELLESIRVERTGNSAWIVLNRPDAINAINTAMREEVPDALRRLDANPEVRVIALVGEGPRGFCSGADLKEPTSAKRSAAGSSMSSWIEAFDAVETPLVAAIHGYCLGGGLEIAMACDIRIADEAAVFALPETRLGLIPGGGGTQRLTRIVGLGHALDLLLTGRRISAPEANRLGLVTRVMSGGSDFRDMATALVNDLAKLPPRALRAAKKAAIEGYAMRLEEGLRLERSLFTKLLDTQDRVEAARAFVEKREPVFTSNQGQEVSRVSGE